MKIENLIKKVEKKTSQKEKELKRAMKRGWGTLILYNFEKNHISTTSQKFFTFSEKPSFSILNSIIMNNPTLSLNDTFTIKSTHNNHSTHNNLFVSALNFPVFNDLLVFFVSSFLFLFKLASIFLFSIISSILSFFSFENEIDCYE